MRASDLLEIDRDKGREDIRSLLESAHARLAFGILAAMAALHLVVLPLTDFYLGPGDWLNSVLALTGILFSGTVALRYGLPRVALPLIAIGLPTLFGCLAAGASLYVAAVSGPFVDDHLAAFDEMIGFDFRQLYRIYQAHPWLMETSRAAYASMGAQSMVIPVALALANKQGRLWSFLAAWMVALSIAVACLAFAPAQGPYVHYGISADQSPYLQRLFPWEFGPQIASLRLGGFRDVTASAAGLVSMPSFHAASAVLFIWATWCWRRMRWPVAVLNVAMIGSVIVNGAHYVADLIAGCLLAVVAIAVVSRQKVKVFVSLAAHDRPLADV